MAVTINGTTGITTPANTVTGDESVGGNLTVSGTGSVNVTGTVVMGSSFKRNRIINGNMLIDQRNAGASVTPTVDGTYTLDRWKTSLTQTSKFSVQQQTSVVPEGFTYALKVTSLSAYSVGAGDTFSVYQVIEGFNIADFSWGTANAKAVTLSFRVYSSLTGTFGGAIVAPSFGFTYPFSYSVASANTWTTISVAIAGPTSGTFGSTNGSGFSVFFGLGSGSTYSGTAGAWASSSALTATGAVSVVGTNGATFYITGVQLEVGTIATPYEVQIYSDQLAQCQRYFETQDWQQNSFRIAVVFSNNDYINMYQTFVVPKRAAASVTWTGNGSGRWVSSPGVATASITVDTRFNATATGCSVSSTALYASYSFGWLDTLGTMKISAEL